MCMMGVRWRWRQASFSAVRREVIATAIGRDGMPHSIGRDPGLAVFESRKKVHGHAAEGCGIIDSQSARLTFLPNTLAQSR